MARATAAETSEYERKRQETIAKNQALLRNLALDAASAGLGPSSRPKATPKSTKKKTPAKRVVKEVVPTRTSSRLKGIVADSEVAKRKAEEEYTVQREVERAKRQRVSGDLKLGDIVVTGNWDQSGNWLKGVGPAIPYERTFDVEDVKETTDKELRALRERMSGLSLWNDIEPNRIKITPERIYAMGFHPTTDKALVFAGDKLGNLGIFDGSQDLASVKDEDDDDEDNGPPAISITTLKLHTRTISAFQFSLTDSNALYSASYDSSIRKLDLAKGVAVEAYGPQDTSEDAPLSGVQLSKNDANMLYFSTLDGSFGIHDMRGPSNNTGGTTLYQLSEKKIGGFTLHPGHPHLVATASLDRYLRIWDLRKIVKEDGIRRPAMFGEHLSTLSVSHAAFNEAGQVATASYDDTVKIYDFGNTDWAAGTVLEEEAMKPKTVVRHNNQTGRWVTILRAQWQLHPLDGVQRFCIGNMNRFVDIYTSQGEQLAQLGGEGITAVPAVAQFHPERDWVCAGTASGKLCLWQ